MTTVTPLLSTTLRHLKPSIRVPTYDRSLLSAGIIHFGVGNFHRRHQALYIHRLLEQGLSPDWGILGASVMSQDHVYNAMRKQDFLFSVIEQSHTEKTCTIVGSHVGHLKPKDADDTLKALVQPNTKLVTLTITEGGYFQQVDTGKFDFEHPQIISDAKDRTNTVFGLLSKALEIRRENGSQPFIVMSCDNVPHNGNVTRNAVAGISRITDSELADWIENNVPFPNSMVDGIVPVTSKIERERIRKEFGIEDDAPVFAEDWKQWVVEDHFMGLVRPPLEDAGVELVDDVLPYEMRKIRILNGGHATIAYPAGLLDIEYAHEAMQHPLIKQFLLKVEQDEILPMVEQVKGMDREKYLELIIDRFGNPNTRDTVRRLCLDGSNRQPKFIVATIKDRLEKGESVEGLALVSSFWCRYCYGVSENGTLVEKNDPNWDILVEKAKEAKCRPSAWLEQETIYGDLIKNQHFVNTFEMWLNIIWSEGTVHALKKYLG